MDIDQAPAVEDDDNKIERCSDEEQEEMGPCELENIFEADQVDFIASQTVASTQTIGEVTPMIPQGTVDDANHDTEENKVEKDEKAEKASWPVKDNKQKKKKTSWGRAVPSSGQAGA